MNLKIQAAVVLNPMMWKYDADEENVYFSNGEMVKKIPHSDLMIDVGRLEKAGVAQFFKDEGMWEELEPTKLRLKEKGFTAVKMKGDKYECWMDEKYQKMFKKFFIEHNGGTYVRVRHPATCKIEAIVLTIHRKAEKEAEENTEN